MATTKQKTAAHENLKKARAAQSARATGKKVPRKTSGLSTAEQNDLPTSKFAFPDERKEPLTDTASRAQRDPRFDQVEGVTDGTRSGVEAHQDGCKEVRRRGVGEQLA